MSVHDVEKYAEVKEILGIPEDEPIFILRGQDKFTPAGIRNYASAYANGTEPDEFDSKWYERVRGCGAAVAQWQEENPDSVKVPD